MAKLIRAFYRNKNVLLTGGTGFLGRCIVEKLLRSFPDIGKIYMLARPISGLSVKERKKAFLKDDIFKGIAQLQTDFPKAITEKLQWIEGDLRKSNLGLSNKTIRTLQDSVNLIIHAGATVRLSGPLKNAILMNVSATNDLLNIASGCKQLDCFTYVSTAYCQSRQCVQHIEETIMEHPITAHEVIHCGNTHTAQELNVKTKDIIQDWPNTYTYTKNAAENLCAERKGQFPIGIYRPGVVMPSFAEPAPYWIGNIMAFVRVLTESHRGLVLEDVDPEVNANSVPVDFTVNSMLMASYCTSIDKTFNIYNYTSSNHPFSYFKSFECYVKNFKRYENLVKRRRQLLAVEPTMLTGKEHEMIKNIQQYKAFQKMLNYSLNKRFTWSNNNIDRMWERMTEDERKLLPFNMRCINWQTYYENMRINMYGTKPISTYGAVL